MARCGTVSAIAVVGFTFLVQLLTGRADEASDGSISTDLEIILPNPLREVFHSTPVYHKDAMFGNPFKGVPDILGVVEYVTAGAQDGCSEDYTVRESGDATANRVFLIDRGNCTFTMKTRIAQSKGANAVIVVNNVCVYMHQADWTSKPAARDALCGPSSGFQPSLPHMAYDNSGKDVTIPAFLVTLWDGQLLKDCTHQASGDPAAPASLLLNPATCAVGKKLVVRMVLNVPRLNRASWEIWMASDALPDDVHTLAAVAGAFRASKPSDQEFSFAPRYLMFDAAMFACKGASKPCPSMCVYASDSSSDDRAFCAVPAPRGSRAQSGAEVVSENIRHMCVWSAHAQLGPSAQTVWWNFLRQFQALQCDRGDGSKESLAACSARAATATQGFDSHRVDDCVKSELRTLQMSAESAAQMTDEAVFTTQFSVNGIRHNFGFTPTYAAQMLCESFDSATSPGVCLCVPKAEEEDALRKCVAAKCFDRAEAPFYCRESDSCVATSRACVKEASGVDDATGGGGGGGMSAGGVLFLLLVVVALVGGAGFVYHRRAKRQMQEEVRDILSEYMPLEELNSFSAGGGNGARGGGFMRAANNDADDTVGVI